MDDRGLTAADLAWLSARGIASATVSRQLDLLRHPPEPVRLGRPCRLGDGVERLAPEVLGALEDAYRAAREAGRFSKFVPASGAASRMFQALLPVLDGGGTPSRQDLESRGDQAARAALDLLRDLARFPFHEELRGSLARRGTALEEALARGEAGEVLRHLLTGDGVGMATRPKGLLPFHSYPAGARSAFEEQFVESATYLPDSRGACRQHFTLTPEHRTVFEAEAARLAVRLGEALGVNFHTGLSVQGPATDTPAVDAEGLPARDPSGRLLLRPGGHGALLGNLEACGGDLVFVKNIDNVLPEGGHPLVALWKRFLGGYLARLDGELAALMGDLERRPADRDALERGLRLARSLCGAEAPAPGGPPEGLRVALLELLDRPLRVCGVVPNLGEPGGGPFWVRGRDGRERKRLVERAEVAPDGVQEEIFRAATHFNPVDLACRLRDHRGRPYPLDRFADGDAVFVTRKWQRGRPLRVLELPGLWNGGMERWLTVFVEVPAATFAPVKTVFDLLRPEHRVA